LNWSWKRVADQRRQLDGRTKEERIAKRAKTLGDFVPRASSGTSTLLENLSVLPRTRDRYLAALEKLRVFTVEHALPMETTAQVDAALSDYLDLRFLECEERNAEQWVVAAYQWAHPEYARLGSESLVRTHRCLKAWGRVAPGFTRPPLPWMLLAVIVARMLTKGEHHSAAMLMMMFWVYLRPGEAAAVREEDLVGPSSESPYWALNLHPSARGGSSKVHVADESLMLDSSEVPWLGEVLGRLQIGVRDSLLCKVEYGEVRQPFEAIQRDLQVSPPLFVLYQLRHGGPSHDRRSGARSLAEIKRRGRWTADSSMRRYEAHALLQQIEQALPAEVHRQFVSVQHRLRELFLESIRRKSAGPSRPLPASTSSRCLWAKSVSAKN
jgi:hypothetical protein